MQPSNGKTFANRRVVLDYQHYENCVFTDATLVYMGGGPPSFRGCRFERCQWEFKGAALNTLQLLRAWANPESGFRTLWEQLFAAEKASEPPEG